MMTMTDADTGCGWCISSASAGGAASAGVCLDGNSTGRRVNVVKLVFAVTASCPATPPLPNDFYVSYWLPPALALVLIAAVQAWQWHSRDLNRIFVQEP